MKRPNGRNPDPQSVGKPTHEQSEKRPTDSRNTDQPSVCLLYTSKQKEQLDALLVGINPFNGKSRAAEISKVLDSYIPNVARMKDQLRKYNVAFTKTAAENEKQMCIRDRSKDFTFSYILLHIGIAPYLSWRIAGSCVLRFS